MSMTATREFIVRDDAGLECIRTDQLVRSDVLAVGTEEWTVVEWPKLDYSTGLVSLTLRLPDGEVWQTEADRASLQRIARAWPEAPTLP